MSGTVDIRQLAVRREGAAPRPPTRPRYWLTRYVLPGVVLLGFAGVIGWAARDSLLPARPVTVVPVLATRAEVRQEGTPLFQAAGWVEPRPTPVLVTALAEGIIDRLLIVEDQKVTTGEPVARLIDRDAALAVADAEANVGLRRAERDSAEAARTAARVNVEQPVQLQAALAEVKALLAEKHSQKDSLPFQLEAAKARLDRARVDHEAKQSSAGVLPDLVVRQARSEWAAARAVVGELEAREVRLAEEVRAQADRVAALGRRLTLLTEERRALADAEAAVRAAEARLAQAETALESARLRLERMVVRAPSDGRVLSLVARPGSRLMGQTPAGHPDASTVVTLYDPASLQVRADVRLEDVPRVRRGQAVRIETRAVPGGPLHGEVLFPTALADIQKNTLQVKVSIADPPATLRPEMLVDVTFLAPPAEGEPTSSETMRLLIPRSLVESAEGGSRVWVADRAEGVARRRTVKLGVAAGDLVEVVEGLTATDRLIVQGREGLTEGERIRITAEEGGGPPAGR